MVPAPSANTAAAFRSFVEQWFWAVAQGRWAEAIAMIDEPNSYGVRWSEASIRKALNDYSPIARVSEPTSATGRPRVTSGEFDDGSGYWVDHDVPLNGAWSDLTAQFEFKRHGTGYAVVLHDIHVL